MKCQNLFSGKNISIYQLLKILSRVLCVKHVCLNIQGKYGKSLGLYKIIAVNLDTY